ncbi:hypothetical protein [Haloferula sargassicola]|uniref:Uncharacterized protein n=1 Tax=Haloferula sargassicola TaxID=490096 RepID=A0ABP9UI21_9BACT
MSQLSPHTVLSQVAAAVPDNCRHRIIIIGSLAAAHAYFGTDTSKGVRTKDVDCVLEPFSIAVEAGQKSSTNSLMPTGSVESRATTKNPAMKTPRRTNFLPSGSIRRLWIPIPRAHGSSNS